MPNTAPKITKGCSLISLDLKKFKTPISPIRLSYAYPITNPDKQKKKSTAKKPCPIIFLPGSVKTHSIKWKTTIANAATPLNPSRISKCCLVFKMSEPSLFLFTINLNMMQVKSRIFLHCCNLFNSDS